MLRDGRKLKKFGKKKSNRIQFKKKFIFELNEIKILITKIY